MTESKILSFDLDFTLAEYTQPHFLYLMIKGVLIELSEPRFPGVSRRYPIEIMPASEEEELFMTRAMFRAVFDLENMNMLKVGENGEVLRAYHGFERLSNEAILKEYGEKALIPLNKDKLKGEERFFLLGGYFYCYLVGLIMRIVEVKKTSSNQLLKNLTGTLLLQDIFNTASINFTFTNEPGVYKRPELVGSIYPELMANPRKYLQEPSKNFISFLKELKIPKVICSNGEQGHYESVRVGLTKMGTQLLDLFEAVAVDCKKPSFFEGEKELDLLEDFKDYFRDKPNNLHVAKGSMKALIKKVRESHPEQVSDKVVFVHVGDSVKDDIQPKSDTFIPIFVFGELTEKRADLAEEVKFVLENSDNRTKPSKEAQALFEKAPELGFLHLWGSSISDKSVVDGTEVNTLIYGTALHRQAKVVQTVYSEQALTIIKEVLNQ